MAEDTKTEDTKATPKAKAPKATVTMRHESERSSYTIGLGDKTFDVVDGEVEVPATLVEAARLLGFR